MQLRQVTWNNSCALVGGVWNFIVNKKRGEVNWSNRPSHLWKSQNSYKTACAVPVGECVRMELLKAQPWAFWRALSDCILLSYRGEHTEGQQVQC